MMGVFIKGMEMPQKCGQCKLYHAEYPMYCLAVEGYRTVGAPYGMPRPDWCPLVEVKEPHGRLGDLDKLKRKAQKVATEAWKMKLTAKVETTMNQFIDWLDNAETIVEAG